MSHLFGHFILQLSIMALPHPDFEKRWGIDDRLLYDYALKNADYIKMVSNHYFKGCYQVRNQYMVDRSNLVIAVYNGTAGGTRNTIAYAKIVGVEIINII